MSNGRPSLRSAPLTTSPPNDGGEERRQRPTPCTLPLPPEGGEVATRSDDGVGDDVHAARSRRMAGTTTRARTLRRGRNEAEALLWLDLKRRQFGGFKFTRQFPIGRYFADFCCREKWLVVELDGSQHADGGHDEMRDANIAAQGYSILRFWNHDVLKHRSEVCETILAALDGRLADRIAAFDLRYVSAKRPPLRSALPTTSPPNDGGEERRQHLRPRSLPLPLEGGEVAARSDDGVGEPPQRRSEPPVFREPPHRKPESISQLTDPSP